MFEQIEIWLKKNLKGDPIIWMIVFFLSVFSVLVVYSAVSAQAYKHMEGNTEYYLIKHLILIGIGFFSIWVAHNINYLYYSKISRFLLILSVPLLLYTYFRGININGASRWIVIPIINQTFQTSDLAKLALISNLASMLAKRQKSIDDFRNTVFPIVGWCALNLWVNRLVRFLHSRYVVCDLHDYHVYRSGSHALFGGFGCRRYSSNWYGLDVWFTRGNSGVTD